MVYTKLMATLTNAQVNNSSLVIYLENNLIFESETNTCAFETSNSLELEVDDPEYYEYYACDVQISRIVQTPNNICNDEKEKLEVGKYIELSEVNEPLRIEDQDGNVLWQKASD